MDDHVVRSKLYWRVLLYALIASFLLPGFALLPAAQALEEKPTWPSGSWVTVPPGFKSSTFKLLWGNAYSKYKGCVWINQSINENDYNYDYYGIAIRLYRVGGSLNPTETEVIAKITTSPTDTSSILPYGFPKDWDPDQGTYDESFDATITAKYKKNNFEISVSFDVSFKNLKIEVGNDYNFLKWRQTRTWWGAFWYRSALGTYKDSRWVAIFAIPDKSHNGNPNGNIDDGDITIYLYIEGFVYHDYRSGSTTIPFNIYDLH